LCIETSDDPFVFIRSYYRCSTEGCSVKKRVERDRDDPSYVVTTYEGVHNHMSAGTVSYASQDAASGPFFVSEMHHTWGLEMTQLFDTALCVCVCVLVASNCDCRSTNVDKNDKIL
jgi:hypothetical protein